MSDVGKSLAAVIESARSGFERLAGRQVEGVSAVNRQDGGWRLEFEVVELARIPGSTSLLGTYEIRVDHDGEVLEYDRVRRYYANRADEEA